MIYPKQLIKFKPGVRYVIGNSDIIFYCKSYPFKEHSYLQSIWCVLANYKNYTDCPRCIYDPGVPEYNESIKIL